VAVGRGDIGGSVTPYSTSASRKHYRAPGVWPRSPEFAGLTGIASWSAAGASSGCPPRCRRWSAP